MKHDEDRTRDTSTEVMRFWQRIPVVIRATFLGVLVSSIGVYSWLIVGAVLPAPLSIAIMVAILWLYIKYFSGSWWPRITSEARRISFREIKLPARVWKWSLASALLIVVIWQAGMVLTFRVLEFPYADFTASYNLTGIPLWVAWLMVIMSSLVAGICEEVGYRGYMQVPLESRYGPGVAVVLVSLVFLVIHLQQVWASPLLLHLFVLSILLGMLAYHSRSLIPSIIAHFSLDIFNFSYWWTDLAGRYVQPPLIETGIDGHFLASGLLFIVSIGLLIWTIRKTKRARVQE